jgi:hypothetical protein
MDRIIIFTTPQVTVSHRSLKGSLKVRYECDYVNMFQDSTPLRIDDTVHIAKAIPKHTITGTITKFKVVNRHWAKIKVKPEMPHTPNYYITAPISILKLPNTPRLLQLFRFPNWENNSAPNLSRPLSPLFTVSNELFFERRFSP